MQPPSQVVTSQEEELAYSYYKGTAIGTCPSVRAAADREWANLIIRLSHESPVIKHLILAKAAVHRPFKSAPLHFSPTNRAVFLKNYIKAMKLLAMETHVDVGLAMISSLMFMVCAIDMLDVSQVQS